MRKKINNLYFKISKKSSNSSSKFIWTLLIVLFCSVIIVPWIKPFGKFFVDIFSPVSFRYISYRGGGEYGWYSSFAYAIGVILISGLLIPIITNYLRTLGNKYKTGTLSKYFWENHILFLGYDELMIGTLRKVCTPDNKMQVVVAVPENVEVVRSRIKVNLSEEDYKQVEVIQCNYTDKDDLIKKACVKTVSQLFIIGQPNGATHDATNQKCLDSIADIVGDKQDIVCYIYFRNQSSLSLIHRQDFGKDHNKPLWKKTNPFNFHQNIASKLLTGFDSGNELMTPDYRNKKQNLAVCKNANVHLVILGMTEMGMALAKEMLMVAHYPGHRVKITLVDDNAREEMFYFKGRYKDLFNHCKSTFFKLDWRDGKQPMECKPQKENVSAKDILDVEFAFIEGSVAHPKLTEMIEGWAKEENWVFTLAICTNDSPKNMATALYLPRTLLEGGNAVQVWVYQQGDNSMEEFGGHDLYKNLHTFSANEYGDIDLQGSIAYTWAEEVQKAYVRSSSGTTSSKKWHDLSQYDRWSTMNNVRSIIPKLHGMGYEIVKEKGRFQLEYFGDGERAQCCQLDLSNAEILKLAETEHIRWNADTLAKGFRPTSDEEHRQVKADKENKSKFKKTLFAHDDIRPYSDLDADTQAYDIDMTEAIINAINGQLRK